MAALEGLMQQRLEHLFDVDAKHFWDVFLFDDDYLQGLYRHLKLKIEHKQLTRQGSGDELVVRRELHLTPDRNLPVALAKLLRGATLVKEYGVFDGRKQQLDIKIELPVIGRLVDFTATYTSEGESEVGFKRVWQAECRARIPLVGRQVERYLLGETQSSLAQAYAFTRTWLREHASRSERETA